MSYDNKSQPPPYSAPPPGFQPAAYYQPPPAHQMPPPPQPQTSTVIITTTRPTLVPLSEDPTRIQCPSCHADILTTVKYQPNGCTHIWALVLCLFIMSYQQPPPPYSQAVPGYYQPPPQHVHMQGTPAPAPGPTVIIHTTAPRFTPVSNEPTTVTCPSCHAVVRTTVIYQPSSSTHLWALILCLF
ncbi:PREDICTED: extensin-1, partial [Rhagoletis zephyria]|uniref:extensin-1 n=1 Tax=Rhagoletis zephyria TaxID=28612 RepID=UPI000811A4C1